MKNHISYPKKVKGFAFLIAGILMAKSGYAGTVFGKTRAEEDREAILERFHSGRLIADRSFLLDSEENRALAIDLLQELSQREAFEYILREKFCAAISNGREDWAKLLIQAGANMRYEDSHRISKGTSLLLDAIKENVRPEMIPVLIFSGADPYFTDEFNKTTAVHRAVIGAYQDKSSDPFLRVLAILKAIAPSPLALVLSDETREKFLGAMIDARFGFESPGDYEYAMGDSDPAQVQQLWRDYDISDALIKFGTGKDNIRPLKSLERLQEEGGEMFHFLEFVNKQDRRGRTALMEAICARRIDIAHLLLAVGANPNICDEAGNSIIQLITDYALRIYLSRRRSDRDHSERWCSHLLRLLNQFRTDFTIQNNQGRTPLEEWERALRGMVVDRQVDPSTIFPNFTQLFRDLTYAQAVTPAA